MKIAIIGVGNMGGAIYQRLKKIMPAQNLLLASHTRPTGVDKPTFFSIYPNDVCERADIIILAVKPQSLGALVDEITVDLSKKIIISILAGINLKKLAGVTGAKKIIRAMPNLPAQVGLGVTGWVATKSVNRAEKNLVKKILATLGYEIELNNEKQITELTVISGCGPAYFFYLCELMERASQRFGFSRKEAQKMVTMTLRGAAELINHGNQSAADWRATVTSKRGVTEAVLKYLKQKKFPKIFDQALGAGIKRSEKLAKL